MSWEGQTTDFIVHELHCKRSRAPLWTSCDSMRILLHDKPPPNVTLCHRKHMEFASKFINVSFQQDIFADPQALNQILPFPRQSSMHCCCSLTKGQFLPSLPVLAELPISISCTHVWAVPWHQGDPNEILKLHNCIQASNRPCWFFMLYVFMYKHVR